MIQKLNCSSKEHYQIYALHKNQIPHSHTYVYKWKLWNYKLTNNKIIQIQMAKKCFFFFFFLFSLNALLSKPTSLNFLNYRFKNTTFTYLHTCYSEEGNTSKMGWYQKHRKWEGWQAWNLESQWYRFEGLQILGLSLLHRLSSELVGSQSTESLTSLQFWTAVLKCESQDWRKKWRESQVL